MHKPHMPKPADLRAPGAIDQLLAFHRAVFGTARMDENGGSGTGDGAGSGDGAGQAGAGDANAGSGGQGSGDAGNGGQQGAQGTGGQGAEKVEDLPEWAQKIIRDTRGEAATNRAGKTEAEQKLATFLDGIAKAVGVKTDDKPDPTQLAADIQAKDATIRDLTIKSALTDALHTNSAKPIARAAILGDGILKDLDPTASDFASKVNDAVKAYIEKNPELKQARAAGTSGADHSGGSGEGANRPKSLGDAVAGHYGR